MPQIALSEEEEGKFMKFLRDIAHNNRRTLREDGIRLNRTSGFPHLENGYTVPYLVIGLISAAMVACDWMTHKTEPFPFERPLKEYMDDNKFNGRQCSTKLKTLIDMFMTYSASDTDEKEFARSVDVFLRHIPNDKNKSTISLGESEKSMEDTNTGKMISNKQH